MSPLGSWSRVFTAPPSVSAQPSNLESARQPALLGACLSALPVPAPEVTCCPAGRAEVEMAERYVKPGERGRRAGAVYRAEWGSLSPSSSPYASYHLRRQQGARLERSAAILIRAADPGWRTQADAAHQEGCPSPGWIAQRCVGALCVETRREWARG